MDAIGPFKYIVDETEQDFFQEAAEGIAKQARLGATVKQLSAAASRRQPNLDPPKFDAMASINEEKKLLAQMTSFQGGKLAMLLYQTSHEGLSKEASERLVSPDIEGYADIVNNVAASSFWEPLGMTKNALDYLDMLEKIGCKEDGLDALADHLLGDSLCTDAAVEAVMEKTAGDERPIEEIYDELVKMAVAGAVGRLLGGLARGARATAGGARSLGRNLVGGEKGIEALRRAGSAVGRGASKARSAAGRAGAAVERGASRAIGHGKFQRAGKAISQRGIRDIAAQPFRRAATAVSGSMRKFRMGRAAKQMAARKAPIKALQAERTALRSRMATASGAEASKLKTQIDAITGRMGRLGQRYAKPTTRRERIMKGIGMQRSGTRTSAREGARKAEGAASKAEEGATAGAAKSKAKGDTKVNPEWEAEVRGRAAASRKGEAFDPTRAKGRGFQEKGKAPQGGKAPQASEKAGKKLKESGYGDIWNKWKSDGWAGLSGAEKRKVYVALGAGYVGQKMLFSRPAFSQSGIV